jgi:hypothetical protein
MKKELLSLSAILIFNFSFSQKINTKAVYQKCTGFAISKPLSEAPVISDENMKESEKKEIEIRRRVPPALYNRSSQPNLDPIAQTNMGSRTSATTIVNWQGTTGNASPPDPSGAAGTNHFYQAINLKHTIYNKTGSIIAGPFALSSLWAGSTNDGDPVVLYDKYADRWFMTQFNGSDEILVAVSTSSNPAGSYFTYTFVPAPGTFPDYPKFSVWSDGYYCTSNLGSPENIAVFDRTQMLLGNPTAGMISLLLPNTPNNGFYAPLPADADGTLPPYGTPCPLVCYEDDTWSTGGVDQLHIFKFTADWITPANSTLALDQLLPTSPINVNFTSSWNDVSQPGTAQKLDAISGVLMFRAQYRRWTGYNTMVVNHAVIVNTTTKQVGIRWYELRQNTTSGVWSIYQEGTYAPDNHSRWMASMAMDDNGSIGMAYAVSSPTVYPSLRYTGRLAGDPLGTMTFSETIAIAGTTSQGGFNRFGDYSQTSLDPDGITFWHTGEYISSGAKTRIFSWQLPLTPTGVYTENANANAQLIVSQSESNLNIKGSKIPGNEELQIDLFDILGKQLINKKVVPSDNSFETNMDLSTLPKATYLLRVGSSQFQKVIKVMVN